MSSVVDKTNEVMILLQREKLEEEYLNLSGKDILSRFVPEHYLNNILSYLAGYAVNRDIPFLIKKIVEAEGVLGKRLPSSPSAAEDPLVEKYFLPSMSTVECGLLAQYQLDEVLNEGYEAVQEAKKINYLPFAYGILKSGYRTVAKRLNENVYSGLTSDSKYTSNGAELSKIKKKLGVTDAELMDVCIFMSGYGIRSEDAVTCICDMLKLWKTVKCPTLDNSFNAGFIMSMME